MTPASFRAKAPAKHTAWLLMRWVNYILRTANNWQRPIRDFELTVERPEGWFTSFCWDGPVEKISPTTFRARAKDFVPQRDLAVYFFEPPDFHETYP